MLKGTFWSSGWRSSASFEEWNLNKCPLCRKKMFRSFQWHLMKPLKQQLKHTYWCWNDYNPKHLRNCHASVSQRSVESPFSHAFSMVFQDTESADVQKDPLLGCGWFWICGCFQRLKSAVWSHVDLAGEIALLLLLPICSSKWLEHHPIIWWNKDVYMNHGTRHGEFLKPVATIVGQIPSEIQQGDHFHRPRTGQMCKSPPWLRISGWDCHGGNEQPRFRRNR